mgnify:CR=1 FL=1
MGKANRKGRSRGGPPFLQLFRYMLESPAWLSLSCQERVVYMEVARLYNGLNNGFLGLGVRMAAERCRINKDTASKCLAVLVERGFLECAQPASFSTNSRQAAEWRLTTYRCDRTHQPPSKAFMRWRAENSEPSPKRGPGGSEARGQRQSRRGRPVPHLRTVGAL